MSSFDWFGAHLDDYHTARVTPGVCADYLAQQLAELRDLAAALISGNY